MDEMVKTVLWSAPLSAVIISGILWLLKSWIYTSTKRGTRPPLLSSGVLSAISTDRKAT